MDQVPESFTEASKTEHYLISSFQTTKNYHQQSQHQT